MNGNLTSEIWRAEQTALQAAQRADRREMPHGRAHRRHAAATEVCPLCASRSAEPVIAAARALLDALAALNGNVSPAVAARGQDLRAAIDTWEGQ